MGSSATSITPDSRIIIVGAGVFGLSTALHLARAGYKHITVFDKQPYFQNSYYYGADGASADVNKMMRMAYGSEIDYQRLTFEAATIWKQWNKQLAEYDEATMGELPTGLKKGQTLFNNCGWIRMSASEDFAELERKSLRSMEKDGLRDLSFEIGDEDDMKRAIGQGWAHKLDPFERQKRGRPHWGVFDTSAGFVSAGKACLWVLHLCKSAGVKFVTGEPQGQFSSLLTSSGGDVHGIRTLDGMEHSADLVIVACGSWTPTLLPEVNDLLESTSGSIVTIKLPNDRPDLWEKYASENIPVYSWRAKNGKSLYGFPRMADGMIKFGYRAVKFTNYETLPDGRRISVPKTAFTESTETNVPMMAVSAVKEFVRENMQDLIPFGIHSTRLCWYTDSIDNSFLIDFVPKRRGLFVCSGGSGHGFKFLPVLGREVLKVLEGKDTVYKRMWQWRDPKGPTKNGLEEGEDGPRVLRKQQMAGATDWKFQDVSSL